MPQGNDIREGGKHVMLLAVSDKSTTDHVQFTVRFASIWLHGKENFTSKLLLWFHTLSPYISYVAQLTCASCSVGSRGGSSHIPSMHTSLSCRRQTVQHSAVCLQCCKRRWTLSVINMEMVELCWQVLQLWTCCGEKAEKNQLSSEFQTIFQMEVPLSLKIPLFPYSVG